MFMTLIDSEDDQIKFNIIFNRYYRLMGFVAKGILKSQDDVEDVVQEALIKIAKNISKISEPESLKTKSFVVLITENTAKDFLRSNKIISVELTDDNINEDDLKKDIDTLDELACIILKLPDKYRDMLLLKHYYGFSLLEISKLLGISLSNAQKLEQRVKLKLKQLCKDEGYEI